MKKEYQTLEFSIIIEKIQELVASSLAKEMVHEIRPIKDIDDLYTQQRYVLEAMNSIFKYGRFPIASFEDITMYVEKTKKEGTLIGIELSSIARQLMSVQELLQFVEDKELEETTLYEYIHELYYISSLHHQITSTIDHAGNVVDNASRDLYRIRKSILSTESNIRTKIVELQAKNKDYLSQETVASRNNHLVLPVKAGYKNQVRGVVHAVSASGQTMFIQPEAVVQLHNQLFQLQNEEREEVQRILFALSQIVKQNSEVLLYNQKVLVELDVLFAKGRFGCMLDGVIPEINTTLRSIELYGARHPLIDKNEIVANDIVLDDTKRLMLISGSNTGGKTVVLKTVGLLSVMALSGLAIPCTNAKIPFFDDVYVDLGDEQSIEQSLSTFSSHMKRLVTICDNVTSNSLVLLDEIGSGTDPREGESIAEAILDYLYKVDAMTFASTHYSGLKQYAKNNDHILIAAVEFDQEIMAPTYRLLVGNVGNSYAIEISSRLGLKQEIIEHAKQIKESGLSKSEKLLEKLENELTYVQKQKDDLQNALNQATLKEKKYTKLVDGIEKQRIATLKDAKDEVNTMLEQAKGQIDEVIEDIKKQQNIKEHVKIDAKYMLDTLKHVDDTKVESTTPNHEYKVGDVVLLIKMNREGEVKAIGKRGVLSLDLGGLKVNVKEDEVQYLRRKVKIKPVKSNLKSIKKTVTQSYEVNVIGMRYEEAMMMVDKFLDNALVHNYSTVRIVHGVGTGVLRNGVKNLLEKHPHVVSYRSGGPQEGGMGATVAFFE